MPKVTEICFIFGEKEVLNVLRNMYWYPMWSLPKGLSTAVLMTFNFAFYCLWNLTSVRIDQISSWSFCVKWLDFCTSFKMHLSYRNEKWGLKILRLSYPFYIIFIHFITNTDSKASVTRSAVNGTIIGALPLIWVLGATLNTLWINVLLWEEAMSGTRDCFVHLMLTHPYWLWWTLTWSSDFFTSALREAWLHQWSAVHLRLGGILSVINGGTSWCFGDCGIWSKSGILLHYGSTHQYKWPLAN